jgi:hypothetical protein
MSKTMVMVLHYLYLSYAERYTLLIRQIAKLCICMSFSMLTILHVVSSGSRRCYDVTTFLLCQQQERLFYNA